MATNKIIDPTCAVVYEKWGLLAPSSVALLLPTSSISL
jgi:hypothetical protein